MKTLMHLLKFSFCSLLFLAVKKTRQQSFAARKKIIFKKDIMIFDGWFPIAVFSSKECKLHHIEHYAFYMLVWSHKCDSTC